jgi:membrane associated rhomboid family serine protease
MPSCRQPVEVWAQERVTRKETGFVLRLIGIIVGIAIGVMVLWLLVDRAMYRWGGLGALIFGFLLVYLLFYLADRRKIKQSEDLIAERRGLG